MRPVSRWPGAIGERAMPTFANGTVILPDRALTGGAVTTAEGRIAAVLKRAGPAADVVDQQG